MDLFWVLFCQLFFFFHVVIIIKTGFKLNLEIISDQSLPYLSEMIFI